MRIFIVIICCLIFANYNYAQDVKRNTVYLELGGASYFYSINYGRLLFNNQEINLSVRMGYMYLNLFNENSRTMHGLPIGLSLLKRLKKNYLEAGISGSVIFDSYYSLNQYDQIIGSTDEIILIPSIRIGIRHQPMTKRVFWNALAQFSMLAVGDRPDFKQPEIHAMPFLSLGIGYSFN